MQDDYGRGQPPLPGLIDKVQQRDRLLELYWCADDPALREVLEGQLRDVQQLIDDIRGGR